jgi:hypothetical protein
MAMTEQASKDMNANGSMPMATGRSGSGGARSVAMSTAKYPRDQRRHFVAGAVGGMTAALMTSPLEVVKTRLQIQGGRCAIMHC